MDRLGLNKAWPDDNNGSYMFELDNITNWMDKFK